MQPEVDCAVEEGGGVKPYYQDDFVTIYHGDCREVLPTLRADAVITDPPYGVGVGYGPSYDDSRDDYWDWLRVRVAAMREAAPVVAFTHRVAAIAELPGWDWVAVWNKQVVFGSKVGNSPLIAGWEPILLYGVHSLGTRTKGLPDVLNVQPQRSANQHGSVGREKWKNNQTVSHPVPKPAALYARLIEGLCPEGTILDPFMGSGTTLRAAKDLGRKAIGIEIEERYCEIAAQRMGQEVLDLGAAA